jgi:hypothetical protein
MPEQHMFWDGTSHLRVDRVADYGILFSFNFKSEPHQHGHWGVGSGHEPAYGPAPHGGGCMDGRGIVGEGWNRVGWWRRH